MEMHRGRIREFLSGFLVAAILSVSLFWMIRDKYGFECKTHYVYIDMDKIIGEITSMISAKKSSLQDSELWVESYRKEFAKMLDSYSTKHQAIIFSSPKPISGALDKTEFFLAKIRGIDIAYIDQGVPKQNEQQVLDTTDSNVLGRQISLDNPLTTAAVDE